AVIFAARSFVRAPRRVRIFVARRFDCLPGADRSRRGSVAGSAPDNDRRRAEIFREALREYFGERAPRDWLEAQDFRLGAWRGAGIGAVARVREKAQQRIAVAVGDRGPPGVFKNSRGAGGEDSHLLFRWRPAGAGAGGIFLVAGCAGVSGGRAARDGAGGHGEFTDCE